MRNMRRTSLVLLIGIVYAASVNAQDTLPSFSVTARGNGRIIVSWRNAYEVVSQISIQRSKDSLKNFTTLLTVPDPHLPENGAVDNKAPVAGAWYRLFIVFDNGKYLFTKSKWPSGTPPPSAETGDNSPSRADQRIVYITPGNNTGKPQITIPSSIKDLPQIEVDKPIFIKRGDAYIGQITGRRLQQYRDSLLTKTRDTLIFIDGDSLLIRPFVPQEVYRLSSNVYTGKYGNVHIALPEAGKKHYALKFYDDGNKLLFELNEIRETSLILDKTNFLHSGWFRFELYEGGQIKEKNKLFIPRDF